MFSNLVIYRRSVQQGHINYSKTLIFSLLLTIYLYCLQTFILNMFLKFIYRNYIYRRCHSYFIRVLMQSLSGPPKPGPKLIQYLFPKLLTPLPTLNLCSPGDVIHFPSSIFSRLYKLPFWSCALLVFGQLAFSPLLFLSSSFLLLPSLSSHGMVQSGTFQMPLAELSLISFFSCTIP